MGDEQCYKEMHSQSESVSLCASIDKQLGSTPTNAQPSMNQSEAASCFDLCDKYEHIDDLMRVSREFDSTKIGQSACGSRKYHDSIFRGMPISSSNEDAKAYDSMSINGHPD
jgi:hypothetical protein